jgi:uncharacterized protein (TIGR02453 family)
LNFKGFSKKGLAFLDDLKANNNKEWFLAHRAIWEKEIKEVNIAFIQEMGEHLQVLVPTIKALPKIGGSLFKIYKDSRFSPSKEPMKTKIGLLFWQGSGHRMQSSSFYMHYQSDSIFIATGIRSFKPDLLKAYRAYILDESNAKELDKILKDITKKGYELPQAHYKRYPKGFNKDTPYAYLSLHNSMYAFANFKPDDIFFSKKIIDRCYNIYEDLLSLQQYLYKI